MCEHKVNPNMNNILGKAMVRGVGSVRSSTILLDNYLIFLDTPYHLQPQKRGDVYLRHDMGYPYRGMFHHYKNLFLSNFILPMLWYTREVMKMSITRVTRFT